MAHYNQKGRKNQEKRADKPEPAKGHRGNQRESNREGHEAGDKRRGVDKGGERGDQRRTGNQNKRGGQSR
ncbi:hypothetical protein [Kribbella sindirgiensis]|uniref:Uncharacterized protein n=1 Tax=Kribbella sindirgiensis TaxID=1124744 RepID=A0A4R0IYR6_9ACTN|nr:hypothetical protein [Kribbella sindirgiensis]TCC36896.1 hypothetical protein E0H50_09405 [Kribbella sindirgiensis]